MSHSFVKNHIHVIFGTKDREKLIPKDIQPELWAYMAGICRNHDLVPIAINGFDDHAHVLLHVPPTMSVAKVVMLIKANSSRWMREKGNQFQWQDGYAAYSVSVSNTPAVANYVRNQQKQHSRISFEDEFLALLKKHGVQFDPKYVFA